jgi:guanosine-3',5'-bis(diphosphate) 3'-pyrophosphohydrolase
MTDPAVLLQALAFAADRHRDQKRKGVGGSPYINHPIAVAALLADSGQVTDQALLVAAILHDTAEDTGTTFAELEARFGNGVAGLVREAGQSSDGCPHRRGTTRCGRPLSSRLFSYRVE